MKICEIADAVCDKIAVREGIIAIDGRCAAGKTSLATELEKRLNCTVIHMDDFFLPYEKRTPERLSQAGGNVDYERFTDEVLVPINKGKTASYHPFSCRSGAFGAEISVSPDKLSVVEGSYSCHPMMRKYYDLRVFLSVPYEEQLKRLRSRNPVNYNDFVERWIPYEEKYFSECEVEVNCSLSFISC